MKEDKFEMALNVYVLMDRRREPTGKLVEYKAQGFKKHISAMQKNVFLTQYLYLVFEYKYHNL